MFSFVGDIVVDPFAGTGTTALAAMECARNSIAIDIEPRYIQLIRKRLAQPPLGASVEFFDPPASHANPAARRA